MSRCALPAILFAAMLSQPATTFAQTPGAADLSIVKTAAVNPITSGDIQTYTIEVTNNGPDTSFGTVVNDSLPSGANIQSITVTGSADPATTSISALGVANIFLGAMLPNSNATIVIEAEVNGNGKNINTATVRTADGCDPDPTNNFSAVEVTQSAGGSGPGANLEITKVDRQDPVPLGSTVTYDIEVTNSGPADAENVVITEKLPSGVDFVGATSSNVAGFVELEGIVTYVIGTLADGETANVTVTVRPRVAGLIGNSVSVRSSTNQSGPLTNNTVTEYTTVTGGAVCSCCANQPEVDLAITKTDSPDPVIVGQPLTYTITVTNVGTTSATGVMVTDQLPDGVTPVSEAVTPTGACSRNGRTVTCGLGTMLPGASSVITLVVIPTETGNLSNTAIVRSNEADSETSNNSTSNVESQVLPDPAVITNLAIDKVARETVATVGQTVTYDIIVSNIGAVNASQVIVTDVLQDNVTFVSANPSQGVCVRNESTVTCRLNGIAPGAIASIVLQVQPTITGQLSNTVTVQSNESDEEQANDSSTEVIDVVPNGQIPPAPNCIDLTGMFKMPPFLDCRTNKKGQANCNLLSWFVLQNLGDIDAKKVTVRFVLSEDQILDAGDKKLRGYKFKKVAAGAMIQVDPRFKNKKLDAAGKYIIAIIDEKNKVAECNEDNNTIVSPQIPGML